MSELKKSLFISFLTKYSILIITIISSMIIARLLTPKEIGLFSVAASLIGIAHTLRDFGVSNYLVQTEKISVEKIRSAFTITAIMAWLIAGVLFLSKDIIAHFYNQPELRIIIQILSLNFIILPFSSISIALLRRDMKFGKLYKIMVSGAFFQAITTITLAWLGYGFYSLAWGGVTNVFITSIATQIISPNIRIFRFSLKGSKNILNFGGKFSVSELVRETGSYAPDLIIGKVMGFLSVGLFSRALGFVSLIERSLTDAIRPIILPYFSQQNREKKDINSTFLSISNYYLAVAFPLLALIALLAAPMIRVLYGTQWNAAIPIAQILCLGMVFKSLNFLIGPLVLSQGHANRIMSAQILYQAIRVTAISYGVYQNDLKMIAVNLIIAEIFGFFIYYSKTNDIKLSQLLHLVFKNIFIGILTMVPSTCLYFAYLNFEKISLLIQSKILPTNYEQFIFIPQFYSVIDSGILILIISFTTLISWLINIFLFQKGLWNEMIAILPMTKKKQ